MLGPSALLPCVDAEGTVSSTTCQRFQHDFPPLAGVRADSRSGGARDHHGAVPGIRPREVRVDRWLPLPSGRISGAAASTPQAAARQRWAARSGETGAGATVAGGAGTGVRPAVIAGLLGGSRERAAGSRLATLR